ncbi:MAG: heparinase II/III family protein [Gemmatimonadales bacterium]
MSVLLSGDALLARREVIAGSRDLTELRAYLDDEVARALAHPLHVPDTKALLSRWGGVCRDDGAELAFDPFTPHAQACTRCGRVWDTEQSHRWWVGWYQLWLAERVLLMALLFAQGGSADGEARAAETLAALAAAYESWPNADNVLGPSRPFFSTYLESVWVLHLAAATSILGEMGRLPAGLERDLTQRLFRPSAALIADFDEGRSNRQVWNAAALLAVGRLVGDEPMARAAAHGPSGLLASLEHNVLADGLWYEGENYHWFALRGLVWGAEMLRTAGEVDLWKGDGEPARRLRAAFRAPILTALPDFTFPARRDSKFGVSLRQRRMAEMWELARARADGRTGGPADSTADATFYSSLLAHVYDPSILETGDAARDITDVERTAPRGGVRRTRLGWKALAWAAPELPPAEPGAWRPGSVHLEATGLAIFRRDEGRTYVGLDYGESGGGHGHPDRLNVSAVARGVPWLLDFGTGSYVSPSLAWYRTTLAHNAPLVDGISQLPADGACVAFDDRGSWGWACAVLPEGAAYDHATIQRTLIVAPDYVLDVVQMRSESGDRQLALPWHGLGAARADEHGLTFTGDEGVLRIHLSARHPFSVVVQRAPGPPAASPGETTADLDYAVAIATGEELTLAACLDPFGVVTELECVDERFLVRRADGKLDVHQASDEGWLVEFEHGDPVQLGGLREVPDAAPAAAPPETAAPISPPLVLDRAEQFRRAEEPWDGKDAFSAVCNLKVEDDDLVVEVDVTAPEPCFRPAGAADPEWENENPDIHGDGAQVYVETAGGFFGWLIVPDDSDQSHLRVSAVRGTDAEAEMVTGGEWSPTPHGYSLRLRITLPEPPKDGVGFDLYVNRGRAGRERRTGQLVWSGARGARLYLAGDRALPGPLPQVRI